MISRVDCRVVTLRQRNLHAKYRPGLIAEIDVLQFEQCSKHQACANQQKHCQRHLSGHKNLAESALAKASR